MIGISIDGPCNAFCGNYSNYMNALFAESQLDKKNQSICSQRVRECAYSNIFIPQKVNILYNLSYLLTDPLLT